MATLRAIGKNFNGNRELIVRMVRTLLNIEEPDIKFLDIASYPMTYEDENIILMYGATARKTTEAFLSDYTGGTKPYILALPDIKKLSKSPENTEHRKQATQALRTFKEHLDSGAQLQYEPNRLEIKLKSGQIISVSNDTSADILPQEIKDFLLLLNKLPYEEVSIEFIKGNGAHSS